MAQTLYVKMFGGFSVRYGDKILTFGRQGDSKFVQLFQILMTRPGAGFSKKSVAEFLYGREEVEDANASLNNTIFRLRKYLRESPLPPDEYLTLRDGVLRFAGGVEVESDAWNFERAVRTLAQEEDRLKKADICAAACALYQGELLPQLSNELWVIEKSREYHEMYTAALGSLLHYLKEEGDCRSIERLAARAAEIYPCEEWEVWQVEGLIMQGRLKDAERIYQETAARIQEAGGFLFKDQQIKFRKMGLWIQHPGGASEDIARCLAESEPEKGAYCCTLPGFTDCFRMAKRVAAREEAVYFSLFLCTILDAGGRPANDREYCKRRGEVLRACFGELLRRGDVYTQYSDGQYLLLCIGAEKENIQEIGTRIDVDFRKRCGGRGGISCQLLDDGTGW